jgi:hypothetical protein
MDGRAPRCAIRAEPPRPHARSHQSQLVQLWNTVYWVRVLITRRDELRKAKHRFSSPRMASIGSWRACKWRTGRSSLPSSRGALTEAAGVSVAGCYGGKGRVRVGMHSYGDYVPLLVEWSKLPGAVSARLRISPRTCRRPCGSLRSQSWTARRL